MDGIQGGEKTTRGEEEFSDMRKRFRLDKDEASLNSEQTHPKENKPCKMKRNANKRDKNKAKRVADNISSAPQLPSQTGDQNKITVTDVIRKFHQFGKLYHPIELFPKIIQEYEAALLNQKNKEKKPKIRPPTQEEKEEARAKAHDPNFFHLYSYGKILVYDKITNEVVAAVEFVEMDNLTAEEKGDFEYISTWLKNCTKFISPIMSEGRAYGGIMYAIGWQKCMKTLEIIGRYINQSAVNANRCEYDELMKGGARAGQILCAMFKKMGDIPVQHNQKIMQDSDVPSFSDLDLKSEPSEFDLASNLTFTANKFHNSVHADKNDLSLYAFGLWLPVFTKDWTLASFSQGFKSLSGPFMFPDYGFGIRFDQHDGPVRMIWPASTIRHCTLLPVESSEFTRLGMSLQISKKTKKYSCKYKEGKLVSEPDMYVANHSHYMAGGSSK